MKHAVICLCLLVASLIGLTARATTNVFFNASQMMMAVSSNITTVTINRGGYLFTYSRDGYFTGVPWYAYTIQRATNAAFTDTVQSWSAQTWADGSITLGDNFADLGQPPTQAFYRLIFP